MKVNPISSANYGNLNNVNFSGRKKDNSQNNVTDVIRSKAATVPVVVLLAANPATLNSAIPAQPIEGNRIEISQAQNDPEIDAKTVDFQEVQNTQQSRNSQWNAILNNYRILKTVPVRTNKGSGTMYFTQYKGTTDNSSNVRNVYIILNGEKPTDDDPPSVEKLIYNKKNNTFAVDICKGEYYVSSIGLLEHRWHYDETPINKEAGLALAKLLTNEYQLKDKTSIDVEIRETSKLQPRRTYGDD